ncbi:MAG: uroporphyrinogen decarboxylase family protein, partial [Candidatus Binatia bacterium]
LTTLFLAEPDRVPLAELAVHRDVKKAFMGKPVSDLKTEVEFCIAAGADFVPLLAGVFRRGNIPRQSSRKTSFRYSLYQGDSATTRNWVEEGRGVITGHEEFEKFSWPVADDIDCSEYETIKSYLPSGMKVVASNGFIFDAVNRLMGTENFFLSLMNKQDLVERMFEKIGNLQYRLIERICEYDCVGAVWMADDVAYAESLMVSPKILKKYLFPWYKKIGNLCRAKNLAYLYHSDGNLWEVMEDIVDAGFNALHPIEPKAMDIKEVKEKFGHRLCLIGNIDLGYTLTRGTPQEVEEEVRQRIRDIAPGGGYCVSSSNSITEYVPLDNFKAMMEATLKHGSYPINC